MNCKTCKHWGADQLEGAPDDWRECAMGRLTSEKKDKSGAVTQRRHPRTLMVGHGGDKTTVATSAFFGCVHYDP